VQAPTLLVVGRDDGDLEEAEHIAGLIPNATVELIDGHANWLRQEEEEEVAARRATAHVSCTTAVPTTTATAEGATGRTTPSPESCTQSPDRTRMGSMGTTTGREVSRRPDIPDASDRTGPSESR
jgi:hypothetical protein